MELNAEGVGALAPDAKAAAAGRKLAVPAKWQGLGRGQGVVWGECRGSALYQVRADLSDFSAKCSCPSRKFPCKHSLGLLFLAAEGALAEAPPPDWVSEWLARRANAKESAEQKRAGGDAPADPAAREKREKKRLGRVAEGLEGLDLWMEDLVRGGLAAVGTRLPSFWEAQAARMVDAQAPGVAARLRRLAEVPNASPDWPERLLDGLGRLALLSEAFGKLDALDGPLAESVRSEVGLVPSREEVLEHAEAVQDEWVVLGQRTTDEDRLKVRRTWLLGAGTRRYGLILQFSAAGAPFAEGFVSGSVSVLDLAFYPGSHPLRALVRARSGITRRVKGLPGHENLKGFLDHAAGAVSRQPWLQEYPAALAEVVPVRSGERWWVRDCAGEALPLHGDDYWPLLALSGGRPVDLACEWDGEALTPLGVVADGTYRVLSEGP